MSDAEALEMEISRNYDAFMERVPELLAEQLEGQFALIRHRNIEGFYQSAGDAVQAGDQMFSDRLFSVQEVRSKPFDLGHFSHGGALREL